MGKDPTKNAARWGTFLFTLSMIFSKTSLSQFVDLKLDIVSGSDRLGCI